MTMTTTMDFDIHLAEQVRLVTEIVPTMSGIEAKHVSQEIETGEERLIAAVSFHGSWEGAMVLECALPMALQFTSNFMSVPLPMSVDDDVIDSIGELANTIAGNFKPLLPPGTHISLPSVAATKQHNSPLPRRTRICQSNFETDFGAFYVKLYVADERRDL